MFIDNQRAHAVNIIEAHLEAELFPDRYLNKIKNSHAFIMELSLGVIRNRRALQWIMHKLVKKQPTIKAEAILLAGLYQLFFMDNVATYAVVNEMVQLGKNINQPTGNFINAVLRNAERNKSDLLNKLLQQKIGIKLSHPDILIHRWNAKFGKKQTESLCKWNNKQAKVTIRLASNNSSNEYPDTKPHPYKPNEFLILPKGTKIKDLPHFKSGGFFVQDPATSLAIDFLNPQPNESILDACAAPGGKAMMIAERMQNSGTLIATDLHSDRLPNLKENADRMAHKNIKIIQADATLDMTGSLPVKLFDRILLDVPCSNTGVIRRKPDAKWRFSEKRLSRLISLQTKILDNTSKLLKQGGSIVYSTCSLEPDENHLLVKKWLKNNPNFTLRKEQQLFPPETETDGAYAALLVKN